MRLENGNNLVFIENLDYQRDIELEFNKYGNKIKKSNKDITKQIKLEREEEKMEA